MFKIAAILLAAAVPSAALSQNYPPWTDELQRQQTEIDLLKDEITTLTARVSELETESDWNMRMWERQNAHDLDRFLKGSPAPGHKRAP